MSMRTLPTLGLLLALAVPGRADLGPFNAADADGPHQGPCDRPHRVRGQEPGSITDPNGVYIELTEGMDKY